MNPERATSGMDFRPRLVRRYPPQTAQPQSKRACSELSNMAGPEKVFGLDSLATVYIAPLKINLG
jgi:hypothetical protein